MPKANRESRYETLDQFLGVRRDPRTLEAEWLYDDTEDGTGIIKLHKTTRAGATTSLSAENIRRGELLTLVCRTNRVITQTMKVDVAHHTAQYEGRDIIHITRNSFCPRLMRLIRKYPQIERLGVLPLPNCDKCEVSLKECPIRYAFETPLRKVSIYCITYAKLCSLMLSRSEKVSNLLSKIFSSRNIIFDETQYIQEADAMQVSIWRKTRDGEMDIRRDFAGKYRKLAGSSPKLDRLVKEASILLERITPQLNELLAKGRQDRFRRHLSITVINPVYEKIIESLKGIYKEASHLVPPIFGFGDVMKTQSLLMKAIQDPGKFDLAEGDIIVLSNLLFLLTPKRVTLSYVKSLNAEDISIQAENTVFYNILRRVLGSLLEMRTDRRIIFTTATFGSFSLGSLFREELAAYDLHIGNRLWGRNGDPIRTTTKSLVIADKAKVSPYNFRKKKRAIVNLIETVAEKYGKENVQILTMNKVWARSLLAELKSKGFTEEDVTWYGSDKTEGVKSRRRIWISVGLAEKPSNAKDHLAETQSPYHDNPLGLEGEELYHFVSQKLRKESVHVSTYQAISRAKDPNSNDRSLVVAVGATEKDLNDCITWGTDRQLIPKVTKRGYEFEVSVEAPLTKPHLTVAPLTADLEESMHIIDQWIKYGKVIRYKLNWIYLKKLVDRRGYISLKKLVNNYHFPEGETQELLDGLPQYFADQGITDHVVRETSNGRIKGVATSEYYRKLTKEHIIYSKEKGQLPVVHLDWFSGLSSAVAHAPSDSLHLSARYFNKHVSSNRYGRLSDFFDALDSDPSLLPGWIVIGKKKGERETRRLYRDAFCLGSWATDFPRRFGVPQQIWVYNHTELFLSVLDTISSQRDAYVSVYAFPEYKHPKEGGNPPVSTIFIDLDIESPEISDLRSRWEKGDETIVDQLKTLRKTMMGEVLEQAKALVSYLKRKGIAPRILLSGFKGVHIFTDFPCVQFSSLRIAKYVIRQFLDQVKSEISGESEVDVVLDTTVIGDLSRLCRIPNTLHTKATRLLGRPQYAVPVTVEELMNLTPEGYDELCSVDRYLPTTRKENREVLVTLTRITQDMDWDELGITPKVAYTSRVSVKDPERLEAYGHECITEILTDEGFEDLNIRPCFNRVRSRKISLDGSGGHLMRVGAVMELAGQELSIPSIVRWFGFCTDYDPVKTEAAVIDLISRGYTDKHLDEFGREHRKGIRCTTIQKCGYCLRDDCPIYRRKFGGTKYD